MKKLHLTFGIFTGIITFIATVIALVLFVNIGRDPYTNLPGWAAFVIVGIYYAIGLAVEGIAWVTAWLIVRYKTCKKQNKLL